MLYLDASHTGYQRKSMVTEEQKKQAQFWLEYSQQLSGAIR